MCSNSVPKSTAVKTNFIADTKHTKMNIIGSEKHSLAPGWVLGVLGVGTLKTKGLSQ